MRFNASFLVLALISVPASAQQRVSFANASAGTTRAASDRHALHRVLREKVAHVNWQDEPLSEVIEWLGSRGAVNVVVHWTILEPLGVSPDTPVTLELRDVTVATALSEVLATLPASEELRYQGVGNILTVSSRAQLNRRMHVKAYALDDLLFRVPTFSDGPTVDLEGGTDAGDGPFGGTQENAEPDEDQRSRRQRMRDLIDVIVQSVEPDQWRQNGGDSTLVSHDDRTLVVRAPYEVHEKLGGPVVLPGD